MFLTRLRDVFRRLLLKQVSSLGHNLSRVDANSAEVESASIRNPTQTDSGYYRNYDHLPNRPRRTNSSQIPCLPTNEGPPIPSPPPPRRLLELEPAEEQINVGAAPLAQDETKLLPYSPKEYLSPGANIKKSDANKKVERFDEIPNEFECCFCTSKDYKEFVDAENLMPLGTSDFRNPVCLEMKTLRNGMTDFVNPFGDFDINTKPAFQNAINSADMGSMDSSDTFASCNTHPYHSQGDLTSNVADPTCAIDSNLYVNPLDKSVDNSPTAPPPGISLISAVKKSASGDTGLRSLGTTPIEESYRGFGGIDRGSRVSLNDSPQPKHRKTRFQPTNRQRTRFGNAFERQSQESLEGKRNSKKSFMTSKGFASASRILNQHLFGLHALSGSRSDSMDSRTSSPMEHHRRSKSILKKSDGSSHKNGDPESERLISDSTSGIDVGSGSEYSSPSKRLSSPPVKHRPHQKLTRSLPLSGQADYDRNRTLKSPLFLLDDIISKDRQNDYVIDKLKECSGSVRDLPLYICPPPPPMDHSPTEETRLLLHTPTPVVVSTPRQANYLSKGPDPSS
ncbi:uncharacterized protein LOC116174140 isoform X2 [Photinus pyralis]|uniref:uncharacterized protein LOC116174140 isoform X2 n=1 Tax=Photinus pyralis TaxID=7054 RepID=UPI0012670D5F|nr:uncharacterized protein LOC116174140 isoform X2 [Photinus pyralis]